jgi:hypothetical protein
LKGIKQEPDERKIPSGKGIEQKPDERKAQLVTESNGNQMNENPSW